MAAQYLKGLLDKYRKTFDVAEPFILNGKKYPAYGYFSSLSEKYVLRKDATLWSAAAYEHVLFLKEKKCTEELLREMQSVIEGEMEEKMVRQGRKYPGENHMYSYLTVIILSEETPSEGCIAAAERYTFAKNYLFTLRGRAEGHLVLVDLTGRKVYTNKAARSTRKFFEANFDQAEA